MLKQKWEDVLEMTWWLNEYTQSLQRKILVLVLEAPSCVNVERLYWGICIYFELFVHNNAE